MQDFSRYIRQTQLAQIGEVGQQKLQQARVLVIGAGGLSATLLPILVGSGIGFIRLYDSDNVEESNLHRQTLYRMSDLGQPKARSAQQHLQQLNPDCEIEAHIQYLEHANIAQACQGMNIVVDAADRFATTYLLSAYCFEHKIPLISASVLADQGYVGGFCGVNTPSYAAVFPSLPERAYSCQTQGVFPSTVAVVASLQAHMLLNVVLDLQPSALGQLLSINLSTWHMQSFGFQHAPEPEQPLHWLDESALQPEDLLFELRGLDEIQQPFVSAVHITLQEVADLKHLPNDRRIVFICKSGVRAAQAAQQLQARGYKEVYILAARD